MTGLTKKEITGAIKDIRADITTLVKGLDPLLKPHKISCDLLRASVKEYNAAKAAFAKKESAKNSARLEKATTELRAAYGTYLDTQSAVNDQNEAILVKYSRLLELAEAVSDREEKRAIRERDRYKEEFEIRLAKVERGVLENLPDVLLPHDDPAPKEEESAAATEDAVESVSGPAVTPIRPAAGATVASVNVAPITIDISTYVERAICATMERLALGMEKKIDAYVASLEIPKPELSPAPTPVVTPASDTVDYVTTEALATTARANNELMTHLLEEQTHVYEKLRTMITNVQGLVDGMTEISSSYLSLSEKQRDTIEIQKSVNDMQRHTAREQQGVKVNQKMISEEQIAISAEQALLADRQKATMDRQKALIESQKAMEETQKALVETYRTLEEAMKSVVASQKEIIQAQQSIINGNAKNIESQKAIFEKQSEIAAAQKEALLASKQLLREQRAHNEKLVGRPTASKPTDTEDIGSDTADGE